MELASCTFTTPRLVVDEWHSRSLRTEQWLADFVRALLTARVTRWLPTEWQGFYTVERAREWVKQRDREGVTLLVLERASRAPVGLVLSTEASRDRVRLGYLLAESVWGRGLASELVAGFVEWCRGAGVASIVAGVPRENVPSRRVLEKCGFSRDPETGTAAELQFELRLRSGEEPNQDPRVLFRRSRDACD